MIKADTFYNFNPHFSVEKCERFTEIEEEQDGSNFKNFERFKNSAFVISLVQISDNTPGVSKMLQ